MRFYSIRNEYETLLDKSYNRYLEETENKISSDPAKFWSYVKSRKKTNGYPSVMHYNGQTASSPSDICELFANFFEGTYWSGDDNGVDLDFLSLVDTKVNIESLCITIDDVLSHLKNVNVGKGDGPDNISPLLLKNCATSLSSPLHHIFNLSLSTALFPKRWKILYVTAIFKNGSRENIENYRGVAILPTFGKLFEAIVCSMLTDKLHTVFSKSQHGFIKGRSTLTNLIDFVSLALKTMESGAQLDVIYTDFKKAFDRVKHSVLLNKLERIGITSTLLNWIRTYLTGRSQFVKLSGWTSRTFKVTSGVPQGSHLGPLLFILFINDVTKVFKTCSTHSLYADDLKICRVVKTLRDTLNLQRDLESLSLWCQVNQLDLNISKCKIVDPLFR